MLYPVNHNTVFFLLGKLRVETECSHPLGILAITQLLVEEQSTSFSNCLCKHIGKTQLPPQLHNCYSEALGLDNEEPGLRDVVRMLGNITTSLTNTRLNSVATNVVALEALAATQPGPSHVSANGGTPPPP